MSTAILVLGMHRSGTSALTRVLNLLGVELGSELLVAGSDNPAGFWEHAGVVDVHERLLAALDRSWSDPRPIPAARLRDPALDPFRNELREIVARFADTPRWAVKDPRLCRLLPLWIPLLEEMQCEPRFVHVWRDPREVAASLGRRNGMPTGLSHLLWLGHVLPAERETRGRLRSRLAYADLLRDWRGTLGRIATDLQLEWPVDLAAASGEIDGFLNPELRHHGGETGEMPRHLRDAVTALSGTPAEEVETALSGLPGDEAVTAPSGTSADEVVPAPAELQGDETGATLDRIEAEIEEAGALFFPWADHVAREVDEIRASLRDRSGRLARLRERVRELEKAGAASPSQDSSSRRAPSRDPQSDPPQTGSPQSDPPQSGSPQSEPPQSGSPESGQATSDRPAAEHASTESPPDGTGLDCDGLLQRDGTHVLRTYETPEGSPCVSIVIPLRDRAELTAKCLESIARHTPDGSYEVILVDNASEDETPTLLACLEGNVKIVRNDENLGFATACNQGAALAATAAILFLNNDTEAKPGWLEPLLGTFDDPGVGVAGAKLLFPDGAIQHAGVALMSRPGAVPLGAFHLHYGEPADVPEANVRMEVPVVTGACLLVRRTLFEELDGFDTFFWNGCEDIDFCLKAGEKGWKIIVEPASELVHHESMSGPERFARTGSNEQLLASRWTGRVPVDCVQDEAGRRTATGAGRLRPYSRVSGEALETGADGDRPVASILVLTCNQLPHTQRCLESIERHTPEPHEIVVVDNGSTDGTLEHLREWSRGKAHVRVLQNRSNRGFGAGCNAGLVAARGRDVVLLNNDTIVTEGWLGGMLDVLEDHPEAGIVGPMTNYASGPQVVSEIGYGDIEGLDRFAADWRRAHANETEVSRRLPAFCWLVRREVVDAIGGFDERFGRGNFEDDDFCLRAAQAGWHARIARGVFLHHVGSRTFAGERIDYRESMEKNFEVFKRKWGMDPAVPLGSYPFDELVAGARQPSVALPALTDRYEHVDPQWLRERTAASSDLPGVTSAASSHAPAESTSVPVGEAPAAPNTHRLRAGVLMGEPTAPVVELFRRFGHTGEIPVFRTGADVDAALRMGGEVLVVAPDVHVSPEALQELIAIVRAQPELGALGATSNGGPGAQHVPPGYSDLSRGLARFVQRRRRRHAGRWSKVDSLDPFCVLLRPDAVEASGGVEPGESAAEAISSVLDRLAGTEWPLAVARGAYVHRSGPSGAPTGTGGGAGGPNGAESSSTIGGSR